MIKISQKEIEDFANIRREMLHRNDKYGLLALDRIEKTIAELRGEVNAEKAMHSSALEVQTAMRKDLEAERKKVSYLVGLCALNGIETDE